MAGETRPGTGSEKVDTSWRASVEGFSQTAENYVISMAPSLRTMAVRVVQRAQLGAGERILDCGTGTGIGAAASLSSGRQVVGVDAASGMLAIARREVPGARFIQADYSHLPFSRASFDVVISVHALHFSPDPAATLAEWRRVTRPEGRLSFSVPGPRAALSFKIYDPIYRKHGVYRRVEVPSKAKLLAWARAAGWQHPVVEADPATTIRLAGPETFGAWLRTGSRAVATGGLGAVRLAALEADLLAATPVAADGLLHIPFGTLYLSARN